MARSDSGELFDDLDAKRQPGVDDKSQRLSDRGDPNLPAAGGLLHDPVLEVAECRLQVAVTQSIRDQPAQLIRPGGKGRPDRIAHATMVPAAAG